MESKDIFNIYESYLQIYENVSSGNAKRASFGGIPQRTSDDEIDKIKNNPALLAKKAAIEKEKAKQELTSRREPILQHKKKLEDLSKQDPKGGVPRDARKLTGRTKDGKKRKETPQSRAKRIGDSIETVPLHLRKTSEEHKSGNRRTKIVRALADRNWGTPAANYDWRQQKRSERSKRLGLNTEEFNFIIDFLLFEGYTDTIQHAELIVDNISENWICDILEEFKIRD